MKAIPLLSFIVAAVLAAGCGNGVREPKAAADPAAVYYEYQVMGEEGEDSVSCRLQCRRGSAAGPTILLDPGATVLMDSTPLAADSAGFSGFYYETGLPAAGFTGKHNWTLTDKSGHSSKLPFTFNAFTLAGIPAQLKRGDLQFEVSGLPDDAGRLHLLLIDTAWTSNDLNALLPVKNGRLTVPAARLAELKSGPISLELRYDETTPLETGSLRLSYGLRRSFDLVD